MTQRMSTVHQIVEDCDVIQRQTKARTAARAEERYLGSHHPDVQVRTQKIALHFKPRGMRNIIRVHSCSELGSAQLQAPIRGDGSSAIGLMDNSNSRIR